MTEDNIAIVFCQDILRTEERDPSILFKNSIREKNFVRILIEHWRKRRNAAAAAAAAAAADAAAVAAASQQTPAPQYI
jgi:hypothetical protein